MRRVDQDDAAVRACIKAQWSAGRIRAHALEEHQLPPSVVDQFLKWSPNAPRPIGETQSQWAHVAAAPVYDASEVQAALARFRAECARVPGRPGAYSHAAIVGTFELVPPPPRMPKAVRSNYSRANPRYRA